MKGGNSEMFYEAEGSADLKNLKNKNYNPAGTIKKMLNLEKIYPDVAKSVFKFNRWHHQVDYSGYKKNELVLKKRRKINEAANNYGMKLVNMALKAEKIEVDFEKTQRTIKGKW
jgi:hypothetical protein